MFFGNTDINKLLAGFLTTVGSKPENGRSTRSNCYHPLVFFHFFQQILSGYFAIIFRSFAKLGFSGFYIERSKPMVSLFVQFCAFIPFAFQGINMYYYRMLNIFHFRESLNQCFHIIAVVHVHIIQSHSLEEITFALTVAVTQIFQVLVKTTVILGNRHLIVVDNNNHVCTKLRHIVQSFECFAAT